MIRRTLSGFLRLALGLVLFLGLAFGNAAPASAAALRCYVKWDASGAGTGASWTNAYSDLQSALGGSACTEVWVAAGTYTPTGGTNRSVSFVLKSGVALFGGFAGGETLLSQRNPALHPTNLSGEIGAAGNADNSYHVVRGSIGNTARLDGFTITAGNADGNSPDYYGGGMFNYYSGNPTLVNVTFSGNSADIAGGGMYNVDSSPSLVNVTFNSNMAPLGSGGGMYNDTGSNPSLVNVTIRGNSASFGGGMFNSGGNPSLVNVTFSGNTANRSGGGMYNYLSSPVITNSILYGDTGGEIFNDGSNPYVIYSIVQAGYPGTGNKDADPLLGPLQDNGGFTETRGPGVGSPAIDSGNIAFCPAEDQRGMARPQDGDGDSAAACDMGAVEVRNPTRPCHVNVNVAGGLDNGASWAYAFTDLQSALADPFCRNIWVARGTYKPTGGTDTDRMVSFVLKSGDTLYGGFSGTETELSQRDPAANLTILSGDIDHNDSQAPVITDLSTVTGNTTNSYHVVTGASGAALDGFTITAGYANAPDQPGNTGAGMYNQSVNGLTLENLVFRGNWAAGSGGGVDNIESTAAFRNVTIAGNQAPLGGGIFNWNSTSTLTNVTFSGNAADYGGGMGSHWSTLASTNVTFSGNSATGSGGGIYNDWSTVAQISNGIFWNNTAGVDAQIGNANGGSAVAVNSIVQGGYAGTGNLDANPLLGPLQYNSGFTQTMAPGVLSPAIDRGTNNSCPAQDQRGVTRPQGTRCDMGAVEYRQLARLSTAAQDGWVLEAGESSSTGGTLNATAATFNLGDNAQDRQYRAILSFNTGALPDNAVITKVVLKVRKQGLVGTDPFTTHGSLLVDIRKGAFSGNNALQLTDFQAAASLGTPAGALKGPALTGGWYPAVLKATAYPYVQKAGITQVRLRFTMDDNDDMSADYMKFYSGEAGAAFAPQLIIFYTVP